MDHDAIISFQNVSKHFGKVKAVDHVNFDIQRGEFFSLLGPSGCGKTTLLRMVAGFETPSSGEVFLDGEPMSVSPPNRRPVNMVFQNYAIFPHLDVRGNIAFGMRKAGLTRSELDQRIDEVLELIKLPGYGRRGADELSGGQRQRVALARALIKQPKVLLLDEPLGALDKKLREQMQIELRQLQQQIGITFLFVTHDQEEALTLSDRIAVMSEGQVIEIASPSQLYESPGSRFVADFIGSMNFFEGEISSQEGSTVRIQTQTLGDLSAAYPAESSMVGQRVWVAIRPEKLLPVFTEPQSRTNSVAGQMGASAYLGDRSHFYVYLAQRREPVLVALQNLERMKDHLYQPNQSVWLQWALDAVVVLPRD
ncbi:MAG: ABC transporter ATP-binding protein [Arenicellales bacterium]|jgi:spermidine/putrescine ABC transporter ATP-binding subunit|nr:ABC transporter ATP-binding protein [Arenicellales bacterium]MDP6290705.1 ABC transporter ATP-binding protein [Arenicellales bacterium]HJL56351.1 ABC transporter ATP-binding protein [Arenicellales bacterium]|tara:strand:- start:158 stop:1258 length:1101 start_codon:yes stop_codon:yes gene_type:complete